VIGDLRADNHFRSKPLIGVVEGFLLIFQTHVFHQFQCWLEPVQNTGQAKMDPEFPINKD
jgi:hypothetical protein